MTSESWMDVLLAAAQSAWVRDKKALLLTRIPGLLVEHGVAWAPIAKGRKLREVIEQDADGRIVLVQSSSHPLVWGVVPKGSVIESPNSVHFGIRSTAAVATVPRYKQGLWTAFSRAMPAGTKRYLHLSAETGGYEDLPESAPAPSGSYFLGEPEVPVGELAGERVVRITRAIETWIANNKIDRGLVLEDKQGIVGPAPIENDTSLDLLLSLFSPAERIRINVPLDVIERLKSTAIRRS